MALYGNILEALDGYYGADVMQKVYNRGVQLGLSGNKDWGKYYKILADNTDDLIEWTTKSGKSVGLWSVRGTTSTTEVALSSTATDLVSVDMAFGTEVGEYATKQLPKLVTAGGTSGSTTVGSFVVGKVLPAIGAVACGVALGVAVDTLLYESNPDYWDEVLPTINPQTWDDILLNHDTKIPLLHNLENGKTYMPEKLLGYVGITGNILGWFNKTGYNSVSDDAFPGYLANVYTLQDFKEWVDTYHTPNKVYKPKFSSNCKCVIEHIGYNNVSYNAYMYLIIFFSDKYDDLLKLHDINLNKWEVYRNDKLYDTEKVNKDTSIYSFTYDGKTVYWKWGSSYFGSNEPYDKNIYVRPAGTVLSSQTRDRICWVAQFGQHKVHHGDTPKGITQIGTVPDLSGLTTLDEVIPKLRATYPDMYNNAIDIPYYDVDTDTTTMNKWIPVTIPTDFLNTDDNIINKPNNKPVSNNLHQTNDGSYPDDDTENKAKENTITDSVTPSIPDNINPINPILPSEQTPSIVIPSTEVDTGLGAVYVPTISQLRSFSEWLWSPNFIDQIKKLFSDPMQGIIGLHQVYFTPSHDGNDTIHCGYLDSEVSSDYTTTRYVKVDCGSIDVKEVFGNVFDYDPLTTIECYLPFIGIVPIKVGDVMRSTLSIEYVCDVLTGACLCNIYVNRDDAKCVLYTYGGNCAVNYPLSSGSYMGIVSALTGVGISIGGAIATGGASLPLSIAGGIASMMNAHTNVKTSGGYSGNTGAMGIKKPYLIIKNTLSAMPDNYNKYIGNPYNNTKKINDCKGFTQANVIHLHGDMLQQEKEEIVNLFNSGVII